MIARVFTGGLGNPSVARPTSKALTTKPARPSSSLRPEPIAAATPEMVAYARDFVNAHRAAAQLRADGWTVTLSDDGTQIASKIPPQGAARLLDAAGFHDEARAWRAKQAR